MIGPVLRLTLRALVLQKRTIMLVLIAMVPVFMSLAYALARSDHSSDHSFYSDLVQQLYVPTVASLVALVFGVSAFGDEREDGTILYPRDETALKHGAGVEQDTPSPREAYAPFGHWVLGRPVSWDELPWSD